MRRLHRQVDDVEPGEVAMWRPRNVAPGRLNPLKAWPTGGSVEPRVCFMSCS